MNKDYNLIIPIGTQVVTRVDKKSSEGDRTWPKGSLGVIKDAPGDHHHAYCVGFPDGSKAYMSRQDLSIRKHQFDEDTASAMEEYDLFKHVIYRCLVGSKAYGLSGEQSDEDRRGVYLPPADLHWSIFPIPEQLENKETDECYWELQKFMVLALKGNPNILECLYTPIIEDVTALGKELLSIRSIFLSKRIYQTYNGYAMSQFKKLEQDLRTRGDIKWKHVMHLIRLLICGVHGLKTGEILVEVGEYKEPLLSIRHEEMSWDAVNKWRLELHKEFEAAFQKTALPIQPDYNAANRFLLKARRSML